jgi:K+-sensing histidine kinase KdpD
MDVEAVLRRKPAVALVDELAHTNVPGSERLKRWQDVHALIEAGIDVLTTMNVQHLESLNDQVFHATGIHVRRGKRVADYLHADCLAVHVKVNETDREAVERHMSFARNLRIATHVVQSKDIPRAITEFARAERITQIYMGRSLPQPWWKSFRETVVQQVVRQARDLQITIVAERRRSGTV